MAYFSSTLPWLIANGFSSETTSSREIPSRVSSIGPMPNTIVLQSLTKINTETSLVRPSLQKTKKLTLFFCWRRALFHCETQKTANTLIWLWQVYWPITVKFRTSEYSLKPETYYRCCLWFRLFTPNWLFLRYTITFHKYFRCSRFFKFYSSEGPQKSQEYPSWATDWRLVL